MNFLFKNLTLLLSLMFIICFTVNANAKPTQSRGWKTKSGHKTTAVALEVTDGKVHLKKANGSIIKVKLDLLVDEDKEFLTKHFEKAPADKTEPSKVDEKPATKEKNSSSGGEHLIGLSQPQGIIVGPIETEGSNYYLYLPKSLKKDRLAPLLFYTHQSPQESGNLLKAFIDGAETLGWILAISVESHGKEPKSPEHVANCMKHILDKWPVDKGRIHYSGKTSGASRAFVNTSEIKAFGVLPYRGYIPKNTNVKTEVIYGISEGNDEKRYSTAFFVKEQRKNGFHRINPGGTGHIISNYYVDGMIWMQSKYMEKNKSKHKEEAADFETSILNWINKTKVKNPQRAYSNACILRDEYKMAGENAKTLGAIITELAADKKNVLYHEGLQEINGLSMKYFAERGKPGKSKEEYDHPKARKAAEKMKGKYSDVKAIMDVIHSITKKTI